jgi:hypothetical protein
MLPRRVLRLLYQSQNGLNIGSDPLSASTYAAGGIDSLCRHPIGEIDGPESHWRGVTCRVISGGLRSYRESKSTAFDLRQFLMPHAANVTRSILMCLLTQVDCAHTDSVDVS